MTPRLYEWIEKEAAEADYLSHKENWTPRMRRIAREFYVIGVVLGALLGCALMWATLRGVP